MSTGTRTIAVVSGGLSEPSSTRLLADRLAQATGRHLERLGHCVHLESVDLREHARAIADAMLTHFPSPGLKSALDTVVDADGLIAVTPVFSASYSGLFKSFFDIVEPEALTGLPVLLGATGGTARHSLAIEYAMRPLFAYLRATVTPTGVFAATDDFGAGDGPAVAASTLSRRIDRAGEELAALVAAGAPHGAVDPFADPPSFAEMLAAGGLEQ